VKNAPAKDMAEPQTVKGSTLGSILYPEEKSKSMTSDTFKVVWKKT